MKLLANAEKTKGGNQTFSNGILIMRLYKTDTTYKNIFGGRQKTLNDKAKGIDAGIR